MKGFLALLGKEAQEIRRTWRLFVLPGLLLFFGLTAPVLASLTPQLVESLATDQPGTIIELPEPVALDAYAQWTKSLGQIILIALIIASADLIGGERRSGTVILVVTKPVSRVAFVLAKLTAQLALLVVATAAGTLVCWLGTRLIFGEAPARVLLAADAVWLVFACLVLGVMTLLSVLLPAQAGAAGVGIAVYAALALLGQWGPAKAYTPAGLFAAIDGALHGRHGGIAWPVVSAFCLGLVCLVLAIWRFSRQELSHAAG